MTFVLAAAPIAFVLFALGVLRWSAAVAGGAGLLVAFAVGLVHFDFASIAGPAVGEAEALGGAMLEALHSALTIIWIIFPALALFEFQRSCGAIDRIRDALVALTDRPRLQAVLIAWFFGLFMEGAAGFGTPVALAAPLLVGLGFGPVKAVALALIGHAVGVSFGAVGTPVLTQAEITGLPAAEIAAATGALHALLGAMLLLIVVRLAGEGPLTRADLHWTALAAACFLVPFLAIAVLVGPELPTLGGALLGGLAFIAALSRRGERRVGERRLIADLAPYLIILTLVLVTRLIPPIQDLLSGLEARWSLLGAFGGAFQPLYHPGSLLLLGFILGGLLTSRAVHLLPAVAAAARRLALVALALLAMLALTRIMVHAGMIAALAEAAANAGPLWPFLSPLVGVLGSFVSGSATASNILFSEFQLSTAFALSLSTVLMLAAQSFGAAVGNMIAPHNIIAGSATVGLKGREGDILAKTATACALYVTAGGVAVLAYSLLT
jgi:lactate permease